MLAQKKKSVNIHISMDNEKTGIPSFNLLAGSMNKQYNGAIPKTARHEEKAAGRGLEGVTACGTCNGDCPGCYAKKMTRYSDVYLNYLENTLAVKTDLKGSFEEIEKQLFSNPIFYPAVVRVHDSGDFFSLEYYTEWMELAKRHPFTKFGAYTKAAEIVNAYGIENIPENFTIQCSPWEGHCEPIGDLPQFIYDDGSNPEIAKLPHCPAVDKNGKRTGVQCKDCLYCYFTAKNGMKKAVYAH